MRNQETIHPAITDVYAMTQGLDDATINQLFGKLLNVDYEYVLQSSSAQEFKEFNELVYAKDSVERIVNRIQEDTMVFKVEEIVNYGAEDFVGKRFYQLRKFGQKFVFDELSISTCIHSRGFVPVSIFRTGKNEFKAKVLNHVYGDGKRIEKSAKGRSYIQSQRRFDIYTDM